MWERISLNILPLNKMSLSFDDLKMIEQIIRICTARGAFQPGELTTVGHIYDKIATIINTPRKPEVKALEKPALPPIEEEKTP